MDQFGADRGRESVEERGRQSYASQNPALRTCAGMISVRETTTPPL